MIQCKFAIQCVCDNQLPYSLWNCVFFLQICVQMPIYFRVIDSTWRDNTCKHQLDVSQIAQFCRKMHNFIRHYILFCNTEFKCALFTLWRELNSLNILENMIFPVNLCMLCLLIFAGDWSIQFRLTTTHKQKQIFTV